MGLYGQMMRVPKVRKAPRPKVRMDRSGGVAVPPSVYRKPMPGPLRSAPKPMAPPPLRSGPKPTYRRRRRL